MITPLGIYQVWARDVVGEKLLKVNGLIYFLKKPDLEHPQQIQLIFSKSERVYSLKCGKDGSTLELTDQPIRESDLGEYGKEVLINISHAYPFVNYIEKNLSKMFLMYSSIEESHVGIRLVFEGYLDLFIVNIGDEINIFESLPSSYERDQCIQYQDL
ncbi:hypothetical protein M1D48_05505 [Erwinia sp. D4-22]